MARAYGNNPDINAQRASVRATDETVPQAKSGYRPQINGVADVGRTWVEAMSPASRFSAVRTSRNTLDPPWVSALRSTSRSSTAYRTTNRVRAAESSVLGSRETLSNNEQNVLFDGATAYMDVLRDTAILDLQRNNVEVIDEQLRQTRDRFNVGEVTRTDVAQAEARLAAARSEASLAEATLRTSIAHLPPGHRRRAARSWLPAGRSTAASAHVDSALKVAFNEHPAIKARQHAVDVAELQVKIEQGDLAPQLGVVGAIAQRYDSQQEGDARLSASVVARLTVPIYEGGQVYAATRQAKETAGQRRLEADSVRDQVRAAVIPPGASWKRPGPRSGGPGADRCGRDGAQRRPRRSPRRPAHHPRRLERAAGTAERSRQPHHRPARPRGRLLRGRPGDGTAQFAALSA